MITALSYKNYTPAQETLKQRGLALVNTALTDPDFQTRWLAQTCTENKGFTQLDILHMLRADIGINFRAYRSWWSKVIGYFVSGNTLWDNTKYLDSFTDAESGSNDLHEVAHVKGFSHYGAWETSVPYTLNRVFEAWAFAHVRTAKVLETV